MRNPMKKTVAFLLAAVGLAASLGRLTEILTPKTHDFGATWGEYLSEPENSVDVMFFGSSVVYCDVVPVVFWETSGLTAYVNAGPEQTLPITLEYVRQSLKTQSPQAIFVECTGVGFHKYMNYTKKNIGQMPWGLPRLRATLKSAEPELRGGLLFPMLFYHDRWDDLTDEDFSAYSADPLAGYTWLNKYQESPQSCKTLVIEPEDWQRNVSALEEIYALCRAEGIELVIFRAPIKRISQPDWNKLCALFADHPGLHLLDCMAHVDEIDAEAPVFFYDDMHYNGLGANRFSDFLGKWTLDHLTLQPRQMQNDDLWRDRAAYFETLLQTPMVQQK